MDCWKISRSNYLVMVISRSSIFFNKLAFIHTACIPKIKLISLTVLLLLKIKVYNLQYWRIPNSILQLASGCLWPIVRFINLLRNAFPGFTTHVAYCSCPIINCKSLNDTLPALKMSSMWELYLCSLSTGNLTCIMFLSNSAPRKTRHQHGHTVLCGATGMHASLHNSRKEFRHLWHSFLVRAINKKSSKFFTRFTTPYLTFSIYAIALVNPEKVYMSLNTPSEGIYRNTVYFPMRTPSNDRHLDATVLIWKH